MRIFGRSAEPALTRQARELSTLLEALEGPDRDHCVRTVQALTSGISALGAMPSEVTDHLWSILLTIVRKALVGGDSDQLMEELRAGFSPQILDLIRRHATS